MSQCKQYVGLACIDGTCPIANREEREAHGYPTMRDCKGCFYYNEYGCEDCYFDGTEYCEKRAENYE